MKHAKRNLSLLHETETVLRDHLRSIGLPERFVVNVCFAEKASCWSNGVNALCLNLRPFWLELVYRRGLLMPDLELVLDVTHYEEEPWHLPVESLAIVASVGVYHEWISGIIAGTRLYSLPPLRPCAAIKMGGQWFMRHGWSHQDLYSQVSRRLLDAVLGENDAPPF